MDPRYVVTAAIASGKLLREPCKVCGDLKVQAHHADYGKPLDVVWLCRKHHLKEHARLKRLGIVIPREGATFSHTFRFSVSKDMMKEIRRRANKEHRTVSGLVRYALIQYLSMPKGNQ